ncbi:MAG: biotin transporter BioY [Chlamydiales bacterium]|nr:biotin transporter BioY [Chlamydiales bacterium]
MKTLVKSLPWIAERSFAWTAVQVLFGGLFIAAMAQICIPLYPVPMTLQTFGVFILAMGQGSRKAFYSTLLYVGFVSLGLPFLTNGAANSLWFLSTTVGYIAAFPIAAYVIGKLVEMKEKPSALWLMGSILAGQVIIYTLGVAGLTRFLSFEQSLISGCLIFLPLAGVKLIAATSLGGLWIKWKKK